jgi:biopolymer transport protein ExbD
MLSDDGGNPLAEVGLALSMAFFSLMILMLVAVLNSAPNSPSVKMGKDGTSPTTEKMDLYIYSDGKLYDEQLNAILPNTLSEQQKILLAVDPQLELTAVLDIIGQVGHQNLQITKLDTAWQERLRIKKGTQ